MTNMKWILGFLLVLTACSSADKESNTYRTGQDRPLVDDKYTLGADAKELNDLRAQIPPEKKRENDEMGFFLNLMKEGKGPPSEIREKFSSALRKKREIFDRDLSKERESFTKEERKKRELFLKAQAQQREQFNREKHSREEKADFSKEMESKRADHFATEREKRSDFESDVQERRKNFEDYSREKNNQFNEEYRNYSRRFEEMKKQENSKKKEAGFSNQPSNSAVNSANPGGLSEAEQLERDLQDAKSKIGSPLESGH
jgi:hypothetical protein